MQEANRTESTPDAATQQSPSHRTDQTHNNKQQPPKARTEPAEDNTNEEPKQAKQKAKLEQQQQQQQQTNIGHEHSETNDAVLEHCAETMFGLDETNKANKNTKKTKKNDPHGPSAERHSPKEEKKQQTPNGDDIVFEFGNEHDERPEMNEQEAHDTQDEESECFMRASKIQLHDIIGSGTGFDVPTQIHEALKMPVSDWPVAHEDGQECRHLHHRHHQSHWKN